MGSVSAGRPVDGVDPCLVLGGVAVLLADPDTEGALEVLREGLGRAHAVVRSTAASCSASAGRP